MERKLQNVAPADVVNLPGRPTRSQPGQPGCNQGTRPAGQSPGWSICPQAGQAVPGLVFSAGQNVSRPANQAPDKALGRPEHHYLLSSIGNSWKLPRSHGVSERSRLLGASLTLGDSSCTRLGLPSSLPSPHDVMGKTIPPKRTWGLDKHTQTRPRSIPRPAAVIVELMTEIMTTW